MSTLTPGLRGEYRHVLEFKDLIDVPDLGVSQIPSEKTTRYWDVTGSQLEHSFLSVLIFPERLMCSLILSPEHRRLIPVLWNSTQKALPSATCQAQVQAVNKTVCMNDLIMHENTSLDLQLIICLCNSCSKEQYIIAKHFYTWGSKMLKLIKQRISFPRTTKL